MRPTTIVVILLIIASASAFRTDDLFDEDSALHEALEAAGSVRSDFKPSDLLEENEEKDEQELYDLSSLDKASKELESDFEDEASVDPESELEFNVGAEDPTVPIQKHERPSQAWGDALFSGKGTLPRLASKWAALLNCNSGGGGGLVGKAVQAVKNLLGGCKGGKGKGGGGGGGGGGGKGNGAGANGNGAGANGNGGGGKGNGAGANGNGAGNAKGDNTGISDDNPLVKKTREDAESERFADKQMRQALDLANGKGGVKLNKDGTFKVPPPQNPWNQFAQDDRPVIKPNGDEKDPIQQRMDEMHKQLQEQMKQRKKEEEERKRKEAKKQKKPKVQEESEPVGHTAGIPTEFKLHTFDEYGSAGQRQFGFLPSGIS